VRAPARPGRLTFRALLALLPALLGGAVIAAGAGAPPAPLRLPIAAAEWQPRPGDVILTASDDALDANIRGASGARATYSHVAIVVTRNGAPAIIEASPFGNGHVAYADLAAFTGDPKLSDLLILRPRAPIDTAALDAEAARLADARIPFDYQFDMADGVSIYCAELAFNLLRTAGLPLADVPWANLYVPLVGDRMMIIPDAFARSASLAPVFRRRTPD